MKNLDAIIREQITNKVISKEDLESIENDCIRFMNSIDYLDKLINELLEDKYILEATYLECNNTKAEIKFDLDLMRINNAIINLNSIKKYYSDKEYEAKSLRDNTRLSF
jgi:hypothetical protein